MKQPPAHHPGSSVDRYALLQRKVQDLERVHQEGKKAYLADAERLKFELARYQKQQMDHAELIEKQKKQNMLLEARVQELKRSKSSEETELKELRSKARVLENECNRLQLSGSEVQQLKNSLQSLEIKRRDDIRERDSRISELEKNLAAEKKARDILSLQNQQLKKSSESETKTVTKKLQMLVDQKTAESSKLQQKLTSLLQDTASREESLGSQLQQHRVLLAHVAAEFGTLVSRSVSQTCHRNLQTQHQFALAHKLKLERKLANSEAQVSELVHLIRHVQGNNALLVRELSDATQHLSLMHAPATHAPSDIPSEFQTFQHSPHQDELQASALNAETAELLSNFYRLHATELAMASCLVAKELELTDVIADQHAAHLSEALASHEAIAGRLEIIGKEYAKSQEQVGRVLAEKQFVERDLRNLTMKIEENEATLRDTDSRHKQALKKEHDTTQRLKAAAQQGHMAENALRQEVNRLTKEVQDLEYYEQAYESLSNQIASLISRNKIAEEEATLLSQHNAEILGHHNPAQRIMYVDRIRRELAEAKQHIVDLQQAKDNAEAQGSYLEQELAMFTSTMVPLGHKPRTNLTRVARVPLANVTENLNQESTPSKSAVYHKADASPMDDLAADEFL